MTALNRRPTRHARSASLVGGQECFVLSNVGPAPHQRRHRRIEVGTRFNESAATDKTVFDIDQSLAAISDYGIPQTVAR